MNQLKIIDAPSPNFNERPESPYLVVMHYTGMKDMQSALDRLRDEKAEVSAHYLIDENGDIYQLVDESKRAWHAGKSYWNGRENINDISIGIELVNPGHEFGYHPFPQTQMESLIQLLADIYKRWEIEDVIGHSDIAPTRKQDPGELFDWALLAAHGYGKYHNI